MGSTIFELWVMETKLWVMETWNPNTPWASLQYFFGLVKFCLFVKLKRCIWREQQFSQNLKINSNYRDSPFTASYLLHLLSTWIFFFFLFLPNHRSVLWFNSFTTQPQHQSLSTNPDQQKNLKPKNICSRSAWEKS